MPPLVEMPEFGEWRDAINQVVAKQIARDHAVDSQQREVAQKEYDAALADYRQIVGRIRQIRREYRWQAFRLQESMRELLGAGPGLREGGRCQGDLLAEEDKLTKDLELLIELDRHIAKADDRIIKQQWRIAMMEEANDSNLPLALSLLD